MRSFDHDAERKKLIEAAISAGADVGPRAITTQMIDSYSGSARTYIYRYFIDKEDLIKKAFQSSDKSFFDAIESKLCLLTEEGRSPEKRFRAFFDSVWEYSVRDMRYCRFYVRFYYSGLLDGECRRLHEENSRRAGKILGEALCPGEKQDIILHHLFLLYLSYIMEAALGYADKRDIKECLYEMLSRCVLFYSEKRENPLQKEPEDMGEKGIAGRSAGEAAS